MEQIEVIILKCINAFGCSCSSLQDFINNEKLRCLFGLLCDNDYSECSLSTVYTKINCTIAEHFYSVDLIDIDAVKNGSREEILKLCILLVYIGVYTCNVLRKKIIEAEMGSSVEIKVKYLLEIIQKRGFCLSRSFLQSLITEGIDEKPMASCSSSVPGSPHFYSSSPKAAISDSPLCELTRSPLFYNQKLLNERNKEIKKVHHHVAVLENEKIDLKASLDASENRVLKAEKDLAKYKEELAKMSNDIDLTKIEAISGQDEVKKRFHDLCAEISLLKHENHHLNGNVGVLTETNENLSIKVQSFKNKVITLENENSQLSRDCLGLRHAKTESDRILDCQSTELVEMKKQLLELHNILNEQRASRCSNIEESFNSTMEFGSGVGENMKEAVVDLILQETKEKLSESEQKNSGLQKKLNCLETSRDEAIKLVAVLQERIVRLEQELVCESKNNQEVCNLKEKLKLKDLELADVKKDFVSIKEEIDGTKNQLEDYKIKFTGLQNQSLEMKKQHELEINKSLQEIDILTRQLEEKELLIDSQRQAIENSDAKLKEFNFLLLDKDCKLEAKDKELVDVKSCIDQITLHLQEKERELICARNDALRNKENFDAEIKNAYVEHNKKINMIKEEWLKEHLDEHKSIVDKITTEFSQNIEEKSKCIQDYENMIQNCRSELESCQSELLCKKEECIFKENKVAELQKHIVESTDLIKEKERDAEDTKNRLTLALEKCINFESEILNHQNKIEQLINEKKEIKGCSENEKSELFKKIDIVENNLIRVKNDLCKKEKCFISEQEKYFSTQEKFILKEKEINDLKKQNIELSSNVTEKEKYIDELKSDSVDTKERNTKLEILLHDSESKLTALEREKKELIDHFEQEKCNLNENLKLAETDLTEVKNELHERENALLSEQKKCTNLTKKVDIFNNILDQEAELSKQRINDFEKLLAEKQTLEREKKSVLDELSNKIEENLNLLKDIQNTEKTTSAKNEEMQKKLLEESNKNLELLQTLEKVSSDLKKEQEHLMLVNMERGTLLETCTSLKSEILAEKERAMSLAAKTTELQMELSNSYDLQLNFTRDHEKTIASLKEEIIALNKKHREEVLRLKEKNKTENNAVIEKLKTKFRAEVDGIMKQISDDQRRDEALKEMTGNYECAKQKLLDVVTELKEIKNKQLKSEQEVAVLKKENSAFKEKCKISDQSFSLLNKIKRLQSENKKLITHKSKSEANMNDLKDKVLESENLVKKLSMENRSLQVQVQLADTRMREMKKNWDEHQVSGGLLTPKASIKDVSKSKSTSQIFDFRVSPLTDEIFKHPATRSHTNIKRETFIKSELQKKISSHNATCVPKEMGACFICEDEEEEEEFNNKYLLDMKTGKCSMGDTDFRRLSELQRRNSLYPPHMRSAYAPEIYCTSFSDLSIEKFRDKCEFSHPELLDLSQATEELHLNTPYSLRKRKSTDIVQSDDSLTSSASKKSRRLSTSYSKPGPPTPARRSSSRLTDKESRRDSISSRSSLASKEHESLTLLPSTSTPFSKAPSLKNLKIHQVNTPCKRKLTPSSIRKIFKGKSPWKQTPNQNSPRNGAGKFETSGRIALFKKPFGYKYNVLSAQTRAQAKKEEPSASSTRATRQNPGFSKAGRKSKMV